MNQKRANTIVQSPEHALSLAILSGCVGARGAKENAAASQEGGGGIVEELGAIICLKTADSKTELCVSVSNKLNNVFMNFKFMTEEGTPSNNVYKHQLTQDKIYNQKYSQLERSKHHNEQVQKAA